MFALRHRSNPVYVGGALEGLELPPHHSFRPLRFTPAELRAEFEPGDATEVAFAVRGATIAYDCTKQELRVNDHRVPAPLRAGRQRLTLLCDRTGLEVFASDGLTYVPMPFAPKADDLALAVEARGGAAKFTALEVHSLKSAGTP